ncbi:uncharacterized protein LOC131971514 [Centropristis striata]|uniref:uncharacterized protein LOC131971514 n=1 Tax=Centropristis striata TaxID=184440 RepID=UPI0027DF8CD6|nr:uncharacterized protein LOC131971514 [Centropristis striata]
MDIKVFDESRTEVDQEAFEYLMKQPNVPVLEIVIPETTSEDSFNSGSLADAEASSGSDDTLILTRSPRALRRGEKYRLAQMVEDILKGSPGGDKIMNEYARTKCLSDSRRRDLVKILVAHMTKEHGTSPPRRVKEDYALGIISLFPYLADPRSKLGYEHYYNAEDGSGYLAWRIKTLQKEASEGRVKRPRLPQAGGPSVDRDPCQEGNWLSDERQCQEAIALMKHTADESVVKEKMRLTLVYRQRILRDTDKSTDILAIFPRFMDIPGLIEQDFALLFGDSTSAKLMEKWSTNIKPKVISQSRGLTQTGELQDLIQNAVATEVEEGWDSDMSSILLLVHLLPPSNPGRKRPGRISAQEACDRVVKFIKTGVSIEGHLEGITQSLQPYLLAVGPKKTIYDIDVEITKVNPRVAELRARMLQ